jgi:REP element-mobilizing transposase RayT
MPDHLHILLSLNNVYKKNLHSWVSAFKRYTTRSAKRGFGIHRLWQKNYYEHIIRKEESLIKIAEYIINNPVRKGLVTDWREYPYSVLVDAFPL